MRRVSFSIVCLLAVAVSACQSEQPVSEPDLGGIADESTSPTSDPDPCGCDPFDPLEAVIVDVRCSPLVATGRTCIEVNAAPAGVSIPDGIPMCTYWKQLKREKKQMCVIDYRCNGSTTTCTFGPYANCVWESELLDETHAPCGANPYADEDTCTPLPPCE